MTDSDNARQKAAIDGDFVMGAHLSGLAVGLFLGGGMALAFGKAGFIGITVTAAVLSVFSYIKDKSARGGMA